MTYIIQNRIVQILYNDRDFSEELKQMLGGMDGDDEE